MIFTFLIILLMCSCKNNSQAKIEISKSSKHTTYLVTEVQIENFQLFLMNFQKDSIFQINRIKFPIKYYIYESGSYMDESGNVIDLNNREVIINENDWKYQNLVEYKKIISKPNDNEYNLELQIEDTGVSVNYIFKLINDKWYLIEIKDESI